MSGGVVLGIMVKLFSILILGFVLNKVGILDEHTGKKLSGLVAKVTAPLLVVSAALSSSAENRGSVVLLVGAGFIMYTAFIFFGRLMAFLFRFPKDSRPIYECMLVFSNNAFMGYPVFQMLFGTEAVFYASMINFAFNIYIYTYAVGRFSLLSGEKGEGLTFKKLFTPGLVITVLAFIIYVSGIRSQGIVYETIYMVGNTTSPLSMLVLGSTLALYPLKKSLTDINSYKFSLIRLIILPVISFGVCRLLNVPPMYTGIITVSNGMPVAALVLMVANDCKAEPEIIIKNIVVTTALSVVTIPILVSFMGRFL